MSVPSKTEKTDMTEAFICDAISTASYELARRGGRYVLCTMCIGVGQGIALIIERI